MQSSGRGNRRRRPSNIQSAVGLTILVSLGLLGWLVLWISNFSFGRNSYRATFIFPNAGGMTTGTRVSYRGVRVGRVLNVKPEPDGVAIQVEISPPDLIIPSNSLIEAIQSGLVGETSIDITPLEPLPAKIEAKPLDPGCNPDLIICSGSRLPGEGKLDVNALIRSLLKISDSLSDPEVIATARAIAQKTSSALDNISSFSGEASGLIKDTRRTGTIRNLNSTLRNTGETINELRQSGAISSLNSTLRSTGEAINDLRQNGTIRKLNSTLETTQKAADDLSTLSNEASALLEDVNNSNTINQLNSALVSVGGVAEQLQVFLALNQDQIADTLASIRRTSEQMQVTVKNLDPLIEQVNQGELVKNLETISANAAELTLNLRNFTTNLNDPTTIVLLQQLLDSARSSFENIQKITSDLDELTGNPQFRRDLMRMIQGLSHLVSSTQDLQQQLQYAQVLNQASVEILQKDTGNQSVSPASSSTPSVNPAASTDQRSRKSQ